MQIRTMVLGAALAISALAPHADAALTAVTNFGTNPGGLSMFEYVPAGLTAGRPIVVVMHGCTQTAANMESAGWNALADQYKFTVVYPEQTTGNNPVRCFNWAGEYGDPANLVRGQGENQSIIQMIDKTVTTHAADPSKVYIVGFSAGAAFASVLAATWPERFAGVAIMSGIPYRCATTVNGAYSCQSPGVTKTAAQWGDLVRGSHAGPYPRIQIWHGAADSIVVPMNGDELVKQWTNAHGTDATADQTEMVNGATRNAYTVGGNVVIETYRVPSLGHAVAAGTDSAGACPTVVGSYFSNKGICATVRAAMFFGLATGGTGPGPGPGPNPSDPNKPTVVITSPSDGDEVTGALTIVVAASDDVAIDHVSLAIDGAEVGTVVDAPYQFAWTATGEGEHTIVATAVDASSNEATTSITVTVPGAGGGGGSNGNNPSDELPGCTLDAGGHHRGGASALLLAFGVVVALRRRRR